MVACTLAPTCGRSSDATITVVHRLVFFYNVDIVLFCENFTTKGRTFNREAPHHCNTYYT